MFFMLSSMSTMGLASASCTATKQAATMTIDTDAAAIVAASVVCWSP